MFIFYYFIFYSLSETGSKVHALQVIGVFKFLFIYRFDPHLFVPCNVFVKEAKSFVIQFPTVWVLLGSFNVLLFSAFPANW